MTQTVKPDRPIWPSVPETTSPPTPAAPRPKPVDAAIPPVTRPLSEGDQRAPLSTFEGFGSFSG